MSFHAAPVLNHPILAGATDRPLTVLVGFWAASAGIVIGNLAFLASNLRGYVRWGSERPRAPEASA